MLNESTNTCAKFVYPGTARQGRCSFQFVEGGTMAKQTSTGKCNLCGETFGKAAMTRHLAKCRSEHPAKGKTRREIFHLLVEAKYVPYYWMHVQIPGDAKLAQLDDFLRETWLECC